jgi:serine phosphatase RsbU (regulator of sigma subunit)
LLFIVASIIHSRVEREKKDIYLRKFNTENMTTYLWTKISQLGVNNTMSYSHQKKVVLSNQLSLLFFVLLLALKISLIIAEGASHVTSTSLVFVLLFIPFLNSKGFNLIGALIMVLLIPFFTVFSTIVTKINHNDSMSILFYFLPRLMLLSYITLPFVLIDNSRKWILFFASFFIVSCNIFYDKLHDLLGVSIFQIQTTYQGYENLQVLIVFPILIILMSFIFLTRINAKYEERIEVSNNQLKLSNNDLEISKQELETKNEIIETINKNMTKSIVYASYIQSAMMSLKNFETQLQYEHFIIHLPHSIVSGDFLWIKRFENKIILSVADCTGHGVPGALLSMLGMAFLNEITLNEKNEKASDVLEKLRFKIKDSLIIENETTGIKDGMDMSICIIDTQLNKMQYAGANNPIYIVRNFELLEFRPTRNPIGFYHKEHNFENQEISLYENDLVYLFSDGFADQFGSENNRKFLSKRFKSTLLNISSKRITEQKKMLLSVLNSWQGNNKQTDDITVLGFIYENNIKSKS